MIYEPVKNVKVFSNEVVTIQNFDVHVRMTKNSNKFTMEFQILLCIFLRSSLNFCVIMVNFMHKICMCVNGNTKHKTYHKV